MAGRKESRPGSRARTTRDETAARVEHIVGMMRALKWERGKSAPKLAALWGLEPKTVENLAAEASRRVRSEVTDPETVTETVAVALDKTLRGALAQKRPDRKAAIMAADVWTRIVGARAPEKHKVDMSVRQYEELPAPALHAKLREQRTRLDEAIAKLEAEHPELAAPSTPASPAEPEGARAPEPRLGISGLVIPTPDGPLVIDADVAGRVESRPIRIGDRLIKPENTIAHGAVGGGLGSRVFTVSELPKWHPEAGEWGCHNIRCDHLCHADSCRQVAEAYWPPPKESDE